MKNMKPNFILSIFLILILLLSSQVLFAQGSFVKHPKLDKLIFQNNKGKQFKKLAFDKAEYDEREGCWRVAIDEKWGIFKPSWKELSHPIEYDYIGPFVGQKGYIKSATAICKKGDQYGVITDYRVILEPEYDKIEHIGKTKYYLKIKKGNLWGLYDADQQNKIGGIEYDEIKSFDEETGLRVVKYQGEWGTTSYKEPFKVDPSMNVPYEKPDVLAKLASCKDATDESCTEKTLKQRSAAFIQYPKLAKDNGIEGIVIAQLNIDENGKIVESYIKRALPGGCSEEVERFIASLKEKWIPAYKDGKAIKSKVLFPVRFNLSD